MKMHGFVLLFLLTLFIFSPFCFAGDFDWMKELNAQASLDPNGFKARLATRFQVGDAKIGVVLSNMGDPANTYMAFRLAEMSKKPVERVMEVYEKIKARAGVLLQRI
ncbi:MAG: hypothetical protein N2596_06485 [Syntrophorhabdaceae bacterium]|nr:hypothetical protein [Syntrophorhabdaceae bacterium]